MSISATSSTGSTPAPVATSASSKTTAPTKTDATSTTAAATSAKDSGTSGPQDTRFNTPMPPQPVSNGLGQTIGQHLNLRA